MVMTSDQISAMTASFQAQTMSQMQNAAMISQQSMGMGMPEAAMGGMINRGAAIGSPLASAGLGLLGLDPFSMGLRGAMWGGARAGAMGAIGGGLAGAAVVGAPLMAAGFVGSQMMGGMQEQQMLNSQLRSSFSFSTPMGRGFAGGDMNLIGQQMRQMTEARGPGGEMSSFDELGRMASMMNRMGMSKGVTDAREFNDKFKQMMNTVKEVAKAFSTSLEEAQQIMGSMRSSGIFRNQGAVAGQIRSYAIGGGIATSEVTSMMGIGSQISRSIGGRGMAGAMGGMHTIGQVGLAQRFGTLSEEDIYNATGMTGAEGRQAMATQMMQSSAQFLKGGLGRRFLASVAGKDGSLNEDSIAEYMYGGVGTGRTMQMAQSNLAGVGRANFVRNEGRLRGEALGKFGGLANVVAMRGWLEERGFDLSSGQDDRAMIFMQRRLGMGNDEAQNMVKMARDMPLLMRGQQNANEEANFNQSIDMARQTQGLSGVKKELEASRQKVTNFLKQAGAEYYAQGANLLERWVNGLTGAYYQDISNDLIPAIREAMSSGQSGRDTLASRFGVRGMGGRGLVGQEHMEKFRNGIFGQNRGASAESFRGGLFTKGPADRYAIAGFAIDATSTESIDSGLRDARGLLSAYRTGNAEGIDRKQYAVYEEMGAAAKDEIRRKVAMGDIAGRGKDRLRSFTSAMKDSNQTWLTNLQGLSEEQQMAVMGATMRGAGLGGFDSSFMALPEEQFLFTDGAFRTKKDRDSAIGDYMLKHAGDGAKAAEERRRRGHQREGTWGYMARRLGDAWDDLWSGKVFSDVASFLGAGSQSRVSEAAGSYLMSERGQELSRSILSSDSRTSADARRQIEDRQMLLQQRAGRNQGSLKVSDVVEAVASGNAATLGMNDTELGEFEANKSMMMSSDFAEALQRGRGQLSDADKKFLADKWTKGNWEDFEARAGSVLASVGQKQATERRQLYKKVGASGVALKEEFETSGLTSKGYLDGAFKKEFAIGKTRGFLAGDLQDSSKLTSGQRFLASMSQSAEYQSQISEFSGEEAEVLLQKSRASQLDMERGLSEMTVKEKRQLASQLRMSGGPEAARSLLLQTAGIQEKLDKGVGGGKGKRERALAQILGADLDKDQLKGLDTGSIEDASNIIGRSAFGSKFDAGTRDDLTKALTAAREGKTGEAANLLKDLQGKAADARRDADEKDKDQNDPGFRRLGEIKNELTGIKDAVGRTLTVNVQNIKELKDGAED
jgi:hypothetical protein